jgi:hypothetical protein
MMKRILWLGLVAFHILRAQEVPETAPPAEMSMEDFRAFLAVNPYDTSPIAAFTARIAGEEHPRMRAHYLAVSYVGFWLNGEPDQARKAYELLQRLHPESFYIEQLNPERMMKACPDCRRAVQRKITCPTCGGTNLCPVCKGKKTVERMGRSKPCHVCNGTGQCTKCDRRGFVKTGVCATCGGDGRVVNRDRLMIAYKQLLHVKASRIQSGRRIRIFGGDGEKPAAEPE